MTPAFVSLHSSFRAPAARRKRVKEAKGYALAVLSNKPDPLVKSIIKKLFPEGVFSFVAGQSELPRKPDPTVPILIADKKGRHSSW
jgi:phosphoglycolate phosphatase-like HAD superfamily hydrolase